MVALKAMPKRKENAMATDAEVSPATKNPTAHFRYPQLVKFIEAKALQRGCFRLASGNTSDFYIDGKMISFDGEGVSLIVDAVLREIEGYDIDAVGGLDMGATPLASAIAYRCHQLRKPISSFVVRKEVKAHGTQKTVEGPIKGSANVAVLDDVVTTGGSIIKAIDAMQGCGCKVLLAISIVDRDGGAANKLKEYNVPYRPLVTLADLKLGSS